MNILVLGAAGFIGINLVKNLAKNDKNLLTLVDVKKEFFPKLSFLEQQNVTIKESGFDVSADFDYLVQGQDVVYHLVSTTVPTTSNQRIPEELTANVVMTSKLLEACVRGGVKKIVFISSGGTVYGKEANCPLKEETPTNPISSYGVQKVTIEKLIYLYSYMYNLDYRIIRLANPYGPFQRPNGILGAVTTFTYKALMNEEIIVYGDGSVIRDYVYIDDVVRAIGNIVDGTNKHRTFNLGCGYGTSVNEVIATIKNVLDIPLNIKYAEARKVDVPINYLDISRYEMAYGKLNPISLHCGIGKLAEFMKEYYKK